jgi:hypothetical protein
LAENEEDKDQGPALLREVTIEDAWKSIAVEETAKIV